MKKLIPLLALAVCSLSMTSCIKTWTCTCHTTYNDNGSISTEDMTMEIQTDQVSAKHECFENEYSWDDGSGYTVNTTCNLE